MMNIDRLIMLCIYSSGLQFTKWILIYKIGLEKSEKVMAFRGMSF